MKNHISFLWKEDIHTQTDLLQEDNYPKRDLRVFFDADSFPFPSGASKSCIQTILFYITQDPSLIRYRQELFAELLENIELYELLMELMPALESFYLSFQEKNTRRSIGNNLYAPNEIARFIECLDAIQTKTAKQEVQSESLQHVFQAFRQLYDSPTHRHLVLEFSEITATLSDIKSVTIGINLDSQLNTVEAGIVSVNNKPYKSGHPIDKFLRAQWKTDGYICRSPLIPVSKGLNKTEATSINAAFTTAFNKIILGTVENWKSSVRDYIALEGNALCTMYSEMVWIRSVMKALKRLKESGKPLCMADTKSAKPTFQSLYHPLDVLGAVQEEKPHESQAGELALILYHLGILLPAEYADIP
jgi:DNA mismatch repair protein MutS